MAYNPNIPLVSNLMVTSQPQIQSNFQTINSVFSKNHSSLNNLDPGRLQGMHTVLTLRPQSTDPTTTVDQVSLYTKTVAGVTSIFFRPSNNQTPIQLTYSSIETGLQSEDPDVFLPRQYTFLAGPFIFYVGRVVVTDGTIISLTPNSTLLYVGLTMAEGGFGTDKSSAAATNINSGGTNFTVRFPFISTTDPTPVFYLAIGQ